MTTRDKEMQNIKLSSIVTAVVTAVIIGMGSMVLAHDRAIVTYKTMLVEIKEDLTLIKEHVIKDNND